jgi:macrolide transport system ATP-binding/permease protein
LRFGLFCYEDLLKPIRALSSGQRRKLQLACLIAARANILLLDEPTNHLSFDVVEAFEEALGEFHGAILAVSHDRRFIERFQTEMGGVVWNLAEGRLVQYVAV